MILPMRALKGCLNIRIVAAITPAVNGVLKAFARSIMNSSQICEDSIDSNLPLHRKGIDKGPIMAA